MNIYKISQTENNRYDTYDSAIVYAETEEEARSIHPSGDGWDSWYSHRMWVKSLDEVIVKKIGETSLDVKSGVILSSFNAG